MQEPNYLDVPDSPDERMQKRRARRWKRRGRIIGPFVGVFLVLAMLILSVDLIEYQPQPPPERLTDRPLPAAITDDAAKKRTRPAASTVSSASVVDSPARAVDPSRRNSARNTALDVTLMPGRDARASESTRELTVPPYAHPSYSQ